MYKVGLIGCGGIGAVHAECWLSMKQDVQLVALSDTVLSRAEKFADRVGARIYSDGYEMLETEELDIVDICLPTFLHTRYLEKAMHHVKNVIIEKPICLTEKEAQTLLDAEKRTGALVQVAHVVRFTDSYQYLKNLVDSGKYGKVISGTFSRISPKPVWMRGYDNPTVTGTMVLDLHIHDVDYIRYLMDCEPDRVNAWAVQDGNGIPQHILSNYCFGDSTITAEASWDYPTCLPFENTFRVRLEKAAVVLNAEGVLTVYPEDGEAFTPDLNEKDMRDFGINISNMKPYMNELQYFLHNIQTQNKNGITRLSEAIASFRLVKKELEIINNAKGE